MVNFTFPGKGSRILETPLTDIHAIVDEAFDQMAVHLTDPYLLYGHSMGAMLAHLLVQRLQREKRPLPSKMVISSFPAPSHHHDRHRRQMDNTTFIAHMKRLGGLPPAVLDEPKLLEVIIPILRADINAIDGYRYMPHEPYNVPILAMFGSQESGLTGTIMDWQDETTEPLTVRRLDGDHFFIYPQAERVMQLITGG